MKVQAESFHLNGHIIGFRPQTQKLESPYKTISSTLAVKRLKTFKEGINNTANTKQDTYEQYINSKETEMGGFLKSCWRKNLLTCSCGPSAA